MWRQLYHVFTIREGIYLGYLVPIVYGAIIVWRVINTKRSLPKRPGVKDILTAIMLLALAADFINYLYLFSTNTGQLLAPNALFVKYTLGGGLWLWIAWYSYEGYFTRRAAGERVRTRRIALIWACAGALILSCIGGLLS